MSKNSYQSLFLNESNITLGRIYNLLDSLNCNKNIENMQLVPFGTCFLFRKSMLTLPNCNIAWGDHRSGTLLTINNENHYLFCGANSVGAYPICVSIGKEENGTLYLIREWFSDIYSDNPKLEQRDFFITTLDDAFSKCDLWSFNIDNLEELSDNEKYCLNLAIPSIGAFNRLFDAYSIQEANLYKVKKEGN